MPLAEHSYRAVQVQHRGYSLQAQATLGGGRSTSRPRFYEVQLRMKSEYLASLRRVRPETHTSDRVSRILQAQKCWVGFSSLAHAKVAMREVVRWLHAP